MNNDILYTPEELALKLKISKYTVYEMIKRGDISAHKIGRSLRISDAQLETYLAKTNALSNTYHASIIEEDGEKYAQVNGVKISVNTNLDGNVKMLIRPEDIILSLEIFPNSARNILKGTVTNIIIEEESAKVFVDTGISIVALITRKSLNDLNIEKGTEIYAIFKTMAIKVFK
ncbi:helix-turn-helix domain-containing protein [Alkaliphilus oremlandii]|uniref:DNA binding domain, excisionase family n=1 Tax=Alkaliphilus oremlandii (strain OhILAs) TaxID=350688 RepID=A8MJ32_ALKOO|nr:helix-turn-helix domain-containing protein [Alkaliphilus oremlandii]ABW19814.1 DNA binding domain, excisionase family [Alkaliphilus oremlandii OhILAs]